MNSENIDQSKSIDQSRSEIAALKTQVFTLLAALIVVSGTLTTFLYRQASLAKSDLTQVQKLNSMVAQNEAALDSFISKLAAYGEKHPDFQPVLKKYSISPQTDVAPAKTAAAPKK